MTIDELYEVGQRTVLRQVRLAEAYFHATDPQRREKAYKLLVRVTGSAYRVSLFVGRIHAMQATRTAIRFPAGGFIHEN